MENPSLMDENWFFFPMTCGKPPYQEHAMLRMYQRFFCFLMVFQVKYMADEGESLGHPGEDE